VLESIGVCSGTSNIVSHCLGVETKVSLNTSSSLNPLRHLLKKNRDETSSFKANNTSDAVIDHSEVKTLCVKFDKYIDKRNL